jgi:hypothetical protein
MYGGRKYNSMKRARSNSQPTNITLWELKLSFLSVPGSNSVLIRLQKARTKC